MSKADDILKKYGITQVRGSESKKKSNNTSNTTNTTKRSTGSSKADSILDKYGITQVRNAETDESVRESVKKRLKELDKKKTSVSESISSKMTSDDDIAPVAEEKKWYQGWFQKGVFEDGYQFGDVTKAILGTASDVAEDVGAGIIGIGEKVVDAALWAAPYIAQGQYNQNGGYNLQADRLAQASFDAAKKGNEELIKKDLYDEREVARTILSNVGAAAYQTQRDGAFLTQTDLDTMQRMRNDSKYYLDNQMEKDSISAEKTDSLAQSGGQLLATAGLQAVGVPWFVTTGATSFGAEAENALNQGATMEEAGVSAAITAGAEILTEKISGGIKFGGKTADEFLTKQIARGVSNKVLRVLAKLGLDMAGEGAEEVLSGFMSNLGSALYKEEKLGEILFSEEAVDEYIESFIGGAALGGTGSVSGSVQANKQGVDAVSGLTANEQKVVDQVYKELVAEAEKSGKISQKEKSKIYDSVLNDLEKGYITTDTIESILGGEDFKAYKDTVDSEDALKAEFDTLNKMKQGEMTGEQLDRRSELKQMLEELKTTSKRNELKTKLGESVFGLVQSENGRGSRLLESYNEQGRRSQAFEADMTQYDAKQQTVIQKAIDSGILNNTNRTHEFVDMIAKISADKGVLFDFTNNQKLKESGFAVDGVVRNGYVQGNNVTLNINAAKSLNKVVGHEITHVLEGTEFYNTLAGVVEEYARAKGEYEARLKSITDLYNKHDPDADPKKELTADLVGDYLFTDPDFINNLSTKHRNVFEKIYDEIKYLCKVATAGSDEARKLEKVKKAFEDAYRADSKTNKAANTETMVDPENDTDLDYESPVKNSIAVADPDTINFLENQEHITTYKAMVLIDGKLYPPMASKVKGEDGKYRLSNPRELGEWQQATEDTTNIKFNDKGVGYYDLKKDDGGTVRAAYNPYEHSSNLVLNDQFEAAYKRDNLVTVECVIPVSEMTSGYKAEHAKDSVGMMDWHSGVVAGKLQDNKRMVYLSRYLKAVRILPDAETAAKFKEIVGDTPVPFNVVSPGLLAELEKIGVNIDYDGSPQYQYQQRKAAEREAKKGVKYSLTDTDGKQLTKEQQDFFKDSKMRDDDGNLMVMYHGSENAGFHIFDPGMSDDDTSLFFVDRNEVAQSYSGTSEVYEARTIRTVEDMNNFLAEIGYDHYKAIEKNGKFELLENNEHVTTKDTMQEIYEEFCWYEGVGEGDANYKVYLNLKNPLVVDAKGRNWDNVSREYWPELHEQWRNEFTEEEKAALIDLAGWEDFSTFKAEVERAVRDAGKPTADEYTKAIDSAYWKNSDMSSLFSMAVDNFSDEVLKAEAVKQLTTRDYAQKAKAEGYDGIIFKNIHDNGGYSNGSEGASTVAIAFDSNQIKSTANAQPTGDPDIRYSLTEEVTDEQNEHGLDTKSEIQFSLSNDTKYMDNAIAKNNTALAIDDDTMWSAKAIRERIAKRMLEIKDKGLVGLPEDREGNTYIANSSYDGTEENTTICPRSLASEAFVDAVSEYLGRPLTVQEQIYISQDLQGRSLTPECTYCYVATDRKAYRAFLGEYINQRDAVLKKLQENANADVSRTGELYKEFLNGRKDTNPMYKRFKMWVDAYKNGTPMVEASHLANINRLMGDIKEFGAELKPQIVDAMKYAQSASWAKKRVNYVAYNGHILNWKQDRINKLNSHYGLRMYSFSDFHPAFVLENMQMITDASVRGLKMLGYTKDTDFVDIFAPTGMNINVSTFGFEAGGNVYENNLIGAEWEKAKALREQYPNVGVTFVATNDTLVEWALAQDWIDVVIPYHLVRTGAEVAKAFNFTNYTSESSDTKDAGWTKGADKKYIAPTEHNNDLQTYLEALQKNHLKPRFERFLNNPNYMKLVNECRQSAAESKPVQPVFNEEAAMATLAKLEANGYYQPIGGTVDRMYEIAAEVAENMTHELAPAMSLSAEGEQDTGRFLGKDMALEEVAPIESAEVNTAHTDTNIVSENIPVTQEEELFPDDLAPAQTELDRLMDRKADLEAEMQVAIAEEDLDAFTKANEEYDAVMAMLEPLQQEENERVDSLGDADVPAEAEESYHEDTNTIDPFYDRDMSNIRTAKSYQEENPDAKPFFVEEARVLLGDIERSTPGQKLYNDEVYYRTGGEKGWMGQSRQTAEDIGTFKDQWGYSWDELRKAAKNISEGVTKTVLEKRLEFLLNDRMLNGYTDMYGEQIPRNQGYINLLNQQHSQAAGQGAFADLVAFGDEYAPMDEDVAPVMQEAPVVQPVKESYEAIRPKREVQPKLIRVDNAEDTGRGKQRKWVKTSTESEVVNREILPDDLDQELTHYEPISNKKTLGNANTKLDNMGYESSVVYFNSQFKNNRVSLDDVALGERLIQEAMKRKDYKTAGELIQNVAILGTELGQKVQALSIIKRLTPEGQLKMLQKTVDRGKTKGDKAYEGVTLTQDMIDKILSTYGNDGSYDQTELNKAVEDVKQQLADQMKVSGMEKVNAWRYLSMLGNPKTHIRNLVSNVAMKGTVAVKNAVARTVESIAPIETRTKTWRAATDEVKAFAKKKTLEMKDVISGDSKYSEDASIKEKRAIFKNKILNGIYEFNSDMLGKEDWWFSKGAFTNTLSEYLTANGIRTEQDIKKNPQIVEKGLNYAVEQAQIATFRQYSWLSNKINEIERKNAATQVAVGSILPFKKTPINIAKTGLSYSPLGFAKTLTYDISQVKKGNMDASELIDHLAQNVTGSALTLVGYMLAQSGMLNGAGEDDKEGEYDYQLGEQAYSINIGDATYSLSWLSPVAMPLFVGANAYEQLVQGKEWNGDVVIETLAQTLDPLSEMSFISSLDDVLSSYDSGMQKFAGIFETAAQSYVSQFAPTLMSQVAQVMDDTKRSTKVSGDSGFKFVDETINKLKYKIPFLRETLEPSTDIWGNEVKQTEDIFTRAFETFLAPYAGRKNIATGIDEEIKALYSETGDTGLIPSVPYSYLNYNGEKYVMSAEEFTDYKKQYGQTAYNLLEDLFATSTYRTADPETRAEMVNMVYDYARDEAKLDYFKKQGVDYTNATSEGEEYYKKNAIKGAIANDMPVDEYKFSVENPEKYEFLTGNGVSYNDFANGSEDFKEAWNWAYNNPDSYSFARAVSDDLMEYRKYAGDLYDIKADKDEYGKSINGSRKEKVKEYINNMDADYYTKIILWKNEYPPDDTYNYEIIDYLNAREDISWAEMITILRKLDFEVDAKGNIYW